MKKKFTFFKTLLVAAGLLGGSCAWAEKTYTTVFSQNYSGSDFATGWSAATADRVGWAQYTRTDVSSEDKTALLVFHNGKNNGASSTYSSLNSFDLYTNSTDSKVEFDLALQGNYGTTAYTASFTINLSGGSKIDINIFNMKEKGAGYNSSVTYTPNGGSSTKLCTLYQDNNGTEQATGLDATSAVTNFILSKVYHVSIVSDETDGVSITIDGDLKNASSEDATSVSAVINSSFERVSTLVFNSGRNGGQQIMLDNLTASIHSDVEIVPEPSAAITGVNGTDRTVTLTLGTGSSDGTVMKYYTDTESKSDLTIYTVPFTVSSTSTIYYYAESTSGATSGEQSINVTCEALTLNSPTIKRSSNTSVTITDDQSNLDASPSSTIYYSYNGNDYTEYTGAITVSVDATISAYSVATGYTNSPTVSRDVAPFPTTVAQIENTVVYPAYTSGAYSETTYTGTKDTYAAYLLDGVQLGSNIYFGNTNWGFRNNGAWYVNKGTAYLMMKDMMEGDIIVVNSSYVTTSGSVNATYSEKYSYGGFFAYVVDEDGDVEISVTKGSEMQYLYGIYAYSNYTSATITSAGFATLYTPYALDFSEVDGLTAYTATVSDNTVTLTAVDDVPANTGVVLKGDADTYSIPVIASSSTEQGSLTGSATTDLAYEDFDSGYTYYILTKDGDADAQFNPVSEGTITAGKAYLKIADGGSGAKLRVVFADDATAIKTIAVDAAENAAIYNLSGQRVNAAYKGIVIKNGKKYLNK